MKEAQNERIVYYYRSYDRYIRAVFVPVYIDDSMKSLLHGRRSLNGIQARVAVWRLSARHEQAFAGMPDKGN